MSRWPLAAAAAALLLSRVLFLPPTLEDIDSVNFARALQSFDPALHRPHPPGYPVFVALAKAVQLVVPSPAHALAALSALAQAGLLFALLPLFRALGGPGVAGPAALLTLACPALWFNGARPMSDSVGLLFIVASLALLLGSLRDPRRLAWASLLVGLAPGARLQSVFLTVPLWLIALARGRGHRLRALGALGLGVAAWLLPLVQYSGGLDRYLLAFSDTFGQAAASEPLLSAFTLNRAARALKLVLLGPWGEPALGLLVLALSALGAAVAALRRPASLALALLAFLPYLLAHLFLQHVETVRYALPYLPLFGYLAAEAIGEGAGRLPARLGAVARVLAPLALLAWSAVLTVPALLAYSTSAAPPYAAVAEAVAAARPPERFAVGAHFVYHQYLEGLPAEIERLLADRPGRSLRRLGDYWLGGGGKDTLFLAEPHRTDLESLDPRARQRLGSWRYGFDDDRFLSGARPKRADLWRLRPPAFFAGEGFLLSLEAGKPEDLLRLPERRAYLRALPEQTFLIVAGEPIGPAAQHTLELSLEGEPLFQQGCGDPLLKGFLLPPDPEPGGYRELLARTRQAQAPDGAPFALRGLDYAPVSLSGFAHGTGWFYPETDERQRPFRWTSVRARTLVHVAEPGARLTIEGSAPLEYVGAGGRVELVVDGETVATTTLAEREFRIEARLAPAADGFRDLLIQTERVFVPDRFQRNGDRRRLGLRVYGFRVETP